MIVTKSRIAFGRVARVTATKSALAPSLMASPAITRHFVAPTNMVLEKHITKVPTMGDSITEGTIVEWLAQVGQKVEEEDVVALIETDKVTVDIKATQAGVITQQFGAIDDEVEVGADLYEIDTEAEATVEASAKAPEPAPAVSAPVPAPAVSAPEPKAPPAPIVSSSTGGRKPSIQFLGKEGWARALTVQPDLVIPANYGRLEFSEEEVEALWTGGANLAPELKEFSTGAVFSA